MIGVLRHVIYRRLFAAQILSLIGTGLMTVALALLAYNLSGDAAGVVVGTILALKMVAYVGFAPFAAALAQRLPVKPLLVGLDLARVALVLLLPFVDQVWQVYALVFAVQLCSAAFTPAFQSLIPEVLPQEGDYTKALSLSRLAYDTESLVSPLLAGLLLTVISGDMLFAGPALGFAASAILVVSAALPARSAMLAPEPFLRRLTKGFALYARTPRLRALFALGFAVSCVGAWVLVNSVVYAHEALGGGEYSYTMLLMAYGGGSMAVALILPRLLHRLPPRLVMVGGGLLLGILPWATLAQPGPLGAIALWLLLGAASSLVMTPGGLLLKRSSHSQDRPALFAAQFSLSHAGWLVAYPLAGWLGFHLGLAESFAVMAGAGLLAAIAGWAIWPADDATERYHVHPALDHAHLHVHDDHHHHEHEGWEGPEPHSHPHRHASGGHRHVFVIDDHHPIWSM
ncbi:MFS transporter [Pelagibius sp. 7325]|uniref:MFS transporter n=1 Tax=Pelagibius sp. 7325 TaxID=3131994 RepID=UPI0030EC0A53